MPLLDIINHASGSGSGPNGQKTAREAFDGCTVRQLKPWLREAGLPISGNKDQLCVRLHKYAIAQIDAHESHWKSNKTSSAGLGNTAAGAVSKDVA